MENVMFFWETLFNRKNEISHRTFFFGEALLNRKREILHRSVGSRRGARDQVLISKIISDLIFGPLLLMTQTSQNAKNHPLPCDRCPCSLTYRSKSNFTAYPLSSDDRSGYTSGYVESSSQATLIIISSYNHHNIII